MDKPHLHFDIDKTLIDTKKMLEHIQMSVGQVGVSKQLFESVIATYLSSLESKTFFDPEEVIQMLMIESPSVQQEQLSEAFWKPENFSLALFPEVIPVLNTLAPSVYLGIFSQGVLSWQEKKLTLAGLDTFFPKETRIIETNKLSEESLARLPERAVIVDDKEEVVEHLRRMRPDLKVFRVDHSLEHQQEIGTISSLSEIVTLLKL